MLYKTLSAAVYGIDANIIEVEVDVSGVKISEDHFHTVGLPDAAVRESRDRVRSALKNCFSTNFRNSRATFLRSCASRSQTAASVTIPEPVKICLPINW